MLHSGMPSGNRIHPNDWGLYMTQRPMVTAPDTTALGAMPANIECHLPWGTRILPELYDPTRPTKSLIVNYIPQALTDRVLFDIFVPYGPIHSVKIMRDERSRASHGYGFVNFMKSDDAAEAQKRIDGMRIQNKTLKVSFARPPSEGTKDTNLYITNLPLTMTLDELGDVFGRFGPIVQRHLLCDKLTGRPRGIGFVRFVYRNDAARAITNLNNFIPAGALEPLSVRVAQNHGQAKASSGYYVKHIQPPKPPLNRFADQFWVIQRWMEGSSF